MIEFDLRNIAKKDMGPLLPFVDKKSQGYLTLDEGEHYKFLAAISDLFSGEIIIDIGTFKGVSAMSLAMNRKNQVVTVNIVKRSNFIGKTDLPIEQIICNIVDVRDNEDLVEKIIQSRIILLDITHNGEDEAKFYDFLMEISYQGILICDDIQLTRLGDMPGFWNAIKETKYDLSKYGHWSGTGLVDFSDQLKIEGME